MTKLAGNLPKGSGNGLDSIAQALVDSPLEVRLVVALVDCKTTKLDNDTGETEPTVRVRRIEPISGADAKLVATVLRRAFEERSGQTVLPFDLEEDLKSAMRTVNGRTGEMFDEPGDE